MQLLFRSLSFARLKISCRILAVSALCIVPGSSVAQTSVLTWHYDNLRSGANRKETILTPANVNFNNFGLLSTKPVDGYVAAQPLYVPNVNIAGQGVHNVVFVVTLHDTVYAFDADDTNAAPLWYTNILTYSPAGATTVPATVNKTAVTTGWTEQGIISTPVINPATNTMYLVAETYENSLVVHRLHALDITSGVEKLGGPTTIAATYTFNGVTTTFRDFYQLNRPGLLMANGHVFIAWGSNGANAYSQGWVMSYSASTLKKLGAVTLEPGKTLASIWQKGAGIAADPDGYLYAVTAEGPYVVGSNLPISTVKFSQVNGVQLTDFFTPYNHQPLAANDQDMTGILLLPPQPGPNPKEMIAIGKEGTIYLLNRTQLGGLCTTCTSGDTQIVQEIPQGAGKASGNPCSWSNKVYFTGQSSQIQAYTMKNGLLVVPPVKSTQTMAGGGHCFVTANGTSNAILWTLSGTTIFAMDATTLKMLYSTLQAPNQRDVPPALPHFPQPIIANGKLYLGTKNSLATYGLLSGPAAPGGK
jgi:hypothetical protein